MVGMSQRGRVLVVVAALVLLGAQATASVLAWPHVRPRLPALAPMVTLLDRAIAAVVSASGTGAAVTVAGTVPATACEKTLLAMGSRFARSADLYTDPGGENALITRIAAALPEGQHPARSAPVGGGAAGLTADFGGGVQLRVSQLGTGWIAAYAETGCRTGTVPAGTAVPAQARDDVTRLLSQLGTAPTDWHADAVGCFVTVDTISQPTGTDNLRARLVPIVPPTARTFAAPANRLAWRDGTTSTVVAASDDGTHITVQRTAGC